ncbi:MAG: DNA-processing protein DprA [Solirubrobacteraceae bacterium]
MSRGRDAAALVALLREGHRPWHEYAGALEQAGSALSVLEAELSVTHGQTSLLPDDPTPLLDRAGTEIEVWEREGFQLVTVLDAAYPPNLRTVHDRPPLIFVEGRLAAQDSRSVAVIGARRASAAGMAAAANVAEDLVGAGYVVVSGLAAGIDTAAHQAALGTGGRTVAVIGTGLRRAYPVENAGLQRRIAAEGAVVSQFWPEAGPSRGTFPRRNAVMSGFALATVVVEASSRSGARVQSRLALAHGRPVFLLEPLLAQTWARELARRPGVHVVTRAAEITATIERLHATDALVE